MRDHPLSEVVEFTSRTARFENFRPVREAVTPYWRWYCECGGIGGRRSTEQSARADHARHAEVNRA